MTIEYTLEQASTLNISTFRKSQFYIYDGKTLHPSFIVDQASAKNARLKKGRRNLNELRSKGRALKS